MLLFYSGMWLLCLIHTNMNDKKELTKAEEQVMQLLWDMERGFVNDILDQLPEPKPAYNTISTIIRILESKGFVGHQNFGKSHQYFPLIPRDAYKKHVTEKLLQNYFDNSARNMLSYFLAEEEIGLADVDEILAIIARNKK